jgi:hypothetical protein
MYGGIVDRLGQQRRGRKAARAEGRAAELAAMRTRLLRLVMRAVAYVLGNMLCVGTMVLCHAGFMLDSRVGQ